jgi:hypothetical protein
LFFVYTATNYFYSFTFTFEGLTAKSIAIMVLCNMMLYNLVDTNVSEEPTATIFRVEEWWEGGPGPDLSATK